MVRKTRRNGGMIRRAASLLKPIGQTVLTIGEEYGKEYAQKKFPKVLKGIYEDPNSASPGLVLSGKKDLPTPNIRIPNIDKENQQPNNNIGGKTKRYKRNKRRKTRRNKKRKN